MPSPLPTATSSKPVSAKRIRCPIRRIWPNSSLIRSRTRSDRGQTNLDRSRRSWGRRWHRRQSVRNVDLRVFRCALSCRREICCCVARNDALTGRSVRRSTCDCVKRIGSNSDGESVGARCDADTLWIRIRTGRCIDLQSRSATLLRRMHTLIHPYAATHTARVRALSRSTDQITTTPSDLPFAPRLAPRRLIRGLQK